jgi:hypothetical protein
MSSTQRAFGEGIGVRSNDGAPASTPLGFDCADVRAGESGCRLAAPRHAWAARRQRQKVDAQDALAQGTVE